MGTALVTDQIDTVLVPLGVEKISDYSALKVDEPGHPRAPSRKSSTWASRAGPSRSILANFDFGDIFSSHDYPRTLFTAENIKYRQVQPDQAEILLPRPPSGDDGESVGFYYQVQQLDAPFDPARATYDYPVTHPGRAGLLPQS